MMLMATIPVYKYKKKDKDGKWEKKKERLEFKDKNELANFLNNQANGR